MITFTTKTFNELSNIELYQLLQLRAEVFVVEQNCPYLDMDNKDQKSFQNIYSGNHIKRNDFITLFDDRTSLL